MLVVLTRAIARVATVTAYTSDAAPLPSAPGTRFVAYDWNATTRPSPLITAPELLPLPRSPASFVLRTTVVPSWRSRRTICCVGSSPLPGINRPLECDTRKRPSSLMSGPKLSAFAGLPSGSADSIVSWLVLMSKT